LWALGTFEDLGRKYFIENLFLYRSNLEYWGIELFVRWTHSWAEYWLPDVADAARAFGNWYALSGGKLLVLGSAGLALWHRFASRKLGPGRTLLDSYQLSVLSFAMFLVFASGFGVQYVGCIVAPLVACHVLRSVLVSTTVGVFITLVYFRFVTEWWPIYSDHQPMPSSFSPLANLAWFSVAYVAWATLDDAFRRDAAATHSGAGEAHRTVPDGPSDEPKDGRSPVTSG
jgi:hypothetical protein